MNENKNTARLAGILYLLLVPFGIFGMLVVPSMLIVPGEASTTVENIMASEWLFRMGMLSDSIVFLIEIVLVALLYVILKPMGKTLTLVAIYTRLAMTLVQAVNLLNSMAVLILLSDDGYLTAFDTESLNAFVMFFIELHNYGALIWHMFFGLHLIALGYLIVKSDYFHRIMGILLMIGSAGYLLVAYEPILFAESPEIIVTVSGIMLMFATVGELWFAFALIIRGGTALKTKSA